MDAGQGATEAIPGGLGRRVAVVALLGVAGLAYFLVLLGSWLGSRALEGLKVGSFKAKAGGL